MGLNAFGYPDDEPLPIPCGICRSRLLPRDKTTTVSKAVSLHGWVKTAVSTHREWYCPKCEAVTAVGPG